MNTALLVSLFLITLEAILQVTVRTFRRDFKWLVNESDELPSLDPLALEKFLNNGFDPELGWSRKPNTSGVEKGRSGAVTYTIDSRGSRQSTSEFSHSPRVAAFGDSYTFCRQVSDDETWESYLAEKLNSGVLNFGVGNYGIDQATLRYEQTPLPSSINTVILGFVPETICRIQSYWKHYLEFGNTFAFKPRFIVESGNKLRLLPNLMQSRDDFLEYSRVLPTIQNLDRFYREKFRKLQFRFPYLISFFRSPYRHITLLALLLRKNLYRWFRYSNSVVEGAPFEFIMDANIRNAHRLYAEDASRQLLRLILLRFVDSARRRGHEPILLVLPQMIDITISGSEKMAYVDFFRELGREIRVLDFTEEISKVENLPDYYTEDLYGGHFSALGNRAVADFLHRRL